MNECTGVLSAAAWLACLDLSGVQDAVEIVGALAVGVAILFAGVRLTRKVISMFQ